MVLEKFNIDTRNGQDVILEILKYKMKHGNKTRKAPMDSAVDKLGNDLAEKGSISSQHVDGNQLAEQVHVYIYIYIYIYCTYVLNSPKFHLTRKKMALFKKTEDTKINQFVWPHALGC